MKIGGLILARMGSTRLPGKALLPLAGKPVVEYMVEKVAALPGVVPVVTMTDRPYDDALEAWCREKGVEFFRGSENDVLGRVAACADKFGFDAVIRLNADNPLLPVPILAEALEAFRSGDYDYVSNVLVRNFPTGVSAEILSRRALDRMASSLADPKYREHVTLYVRENPKEFKTRSIEPRVPGGRGRQLALDTEADFRAIEAVLGRFKKSHAAVSYEELLDAAVQEPPTVLVQGAKGAKLLIEAFGKAAGARWLAYDVRAIEVLKAAGIAFEDLNEGPEAARFDELEEAAHRWSRRWFADADAPEGAFYQREFNYFFLGVLRAHALLEAAFADGKPRRVVTTRCAGAVRGIREGREESAVPELLSRFGAAWGVYPEFRSLAPERVHAPKEQGVLGRALEGAGKMLAAAKRSDTLFSGNVSLLGPVRAKIAARENAPGLWLRWIQKDEGWLRAAQPDFLPFRPAPRDQEGEIPADLGALFARKETFVFRGFDFWPLVRPRVEFYFRTLAPAAKRDFEGLRALLRSAKVRRVVLDEDVTERNAALALAAEAEGVDTTVVLHGTPIKPLGFVPVKSRRVAAWGRYGAETLVRWGVDPARIRVTGCPRYDHLKREAARFDRAAFLKKHGFDSSRPIVLAAPAHLPFNGLERFDGLESNPFEYARFVENFIRAARKAPGVQVVLRYHSGALDQALFDMIARRAGGSPANLRVSREGAAIPFILASELVFCAYSSLIFEAMVLGKPVAITNFSKHEDPIRFLDLARAPSVRDEASAQALCLSVAEKNFRPEPFLEAQSRWLEPFLAGADGGAAERAADWILDAKLPARQTSFAEEGAR